MIKWDCGCIGIDDTKNSTGQVFLLTNCDGNGNHDINPGWRQMKNKTFVVMAFPDAINVLDKMADLVYMGQRFHELKNLLGIR